MRFRTYNHFVNDASVWNNVVNDFFDNLAQEYSRSGGSNGGSNGTSNGDSNGATSGVSDGVKVDQPGETLLPIDVWATADAFQVNAYLPGVNPEDVEITFEADELQIRGKLPASPEGTEFIKRELFHGSFVRRLTFNVPVNADSIEAHLQNGLLTLTIPKAEVVKPKTIKIQTK